MEVWLTFFGIGIALGIFGLIRVVRYFMFIRVARVGEHIVVMTDNAIKKFEGQSEELADLSHTISLNQAARRIIEDDKQLLGLARWLWPDTTSRGVVDISESRVVATLLYVREKISQMGVIDSQREGLGVKKKFKGFMGELEFQTMGGGAQSIKDYAKAIRDLAAGEVMWATMFFASGSLIIALFALWFAAHQ